LPTPMASQADKSEHTLQVVANGQSQITLDRLIAMLPTPKVSDAWFADTPMEVIQESLAKKSRAESQLAAQIGQNTGLQLQPAFAEWMMGFPTGWTDLKLSVEA